MLSLLISNPKRLLLSLKKNDEKLRTSLTGIEMPPNPKTGFVLCLGSEREIYMAQCDKIHQGTQNSA
jgi:hypothetical protein